MNENCLLGAEELFSMADFQETGDTGQLLAPDLTKRDKNKQNVIMMNQIFVDFYGVKGKIRRM